MMCPGVCRIREVYNMGSLQEPRKEDAVVVDKPGPHDNYSCYRLHNSSASQNAAPSTPPLARDLFGVVREACAQQNVKWPVECQVIQDKVHHIEDWPLYPEAFYEASGTELRPQPVGDELGRVVYQYYPTSSVNYFSRSCVGGNKFLNEDVRPPLEDENDTTLQFESRFECANLAKVVQVSECYYELHLRADMYTSRHTQWFYFAVSNTRKDITYRFSIVNLSKGDSLYNHGMRPLMYSSEEADNHGVGWRRCATNIVYFKNHDSSDNACFDSDDDGEDDAPSYTLTFNVTFPHDHDTVYIAHCYPYSYSDLQEHLLTIQNDPFKSNVCRQRVLCRSLAGNPVYLLTITSPEPEEDGKKKRAVVLTARVHPGETPSSWIMKGILDFLTADHPKAHDLRSQFIFKVIPMLNPDGVIVGNHRCSLVGRDLNRQYKMVVKEMFPAIWHTKAMVRRLMDEHGVVMYGDFHAHSRKHNIFLYGCENRRNQDNHLREQIFPLLLHYNGGDKFSFRSCKFKVQRCKEGTARVVVWMMGVLHSYTMEASFGGASEGPRAGTHYNIQDLISMGRQFCETLVEYFDPQPIKEKLRNKLWSRLIKKGSSADEPASIDFSETNSSSGESDRQTTPVRMRKKKVQRHPRRKGAGRQSVAQEKAERRPKGLHHSRSGSSGSPSTSCRDSLPAHGDRVSGKGAGGAAEESGLDSAPYKAATDTKPCLKKLSERPTTSNSVLDLSSGRTSLRPTQYKLEEALPTPCSAPPLRRSSHSLIRPTHSSSAPREASISPVPPEKPTTGSVNETLVHRLISNHKHKDPIHSDGYDLDGQESVELRGYLDGGTKSYMERMGELMANRLAISDTEEGSVTNFWETDLPSRTMLSTPRNSHSSLRRLDALEPVVAKTRLHDPRRQPRPVRSPQSVYASVRAAQVIQRGTSRVHKSPLSRKRSDDQWDKKRDSHRQLHYYADDRTKENRNYFDSRNHYEGYDDNLLWVRGPHGEPTDVLTDPIHNGNLTYHRYSSQPTQLDMGPCEDLLVSGEEVVLRLSVPSIPRVSSGSKAGDEPSASQVVRRGSSRKSGTRANSGKPKGTKDIDEEQLCADIATCDTLFLDTAAQETPELIAARNLKGKLKKKKSVKPGGSKDSEKHRASKQDQDGEQSGGGSKPSKAEDEDKESSESTPPDGKVKKKIKIVIGKKTKKVSKKNLPDKDS
ncbi:cytosolic carboxypeptidase 2 isoform X2 [Penaeus vannamei]|uniref:cytosolic carboxypeptidase 2 isoform X2 n=1 Tax=Penaeus vannamei TaxID=6689 RepID=UPI00387F70F3